MTTLFRYLDLETISSCNRTCITCIRNSHPHKDVIQPWHEKHYLSEDVIYMAVDQAVSLGFRGGICLSHYNEPLMDERLPEIVANIRTMGKFEEIFLNTNGDFLTPELAQSLDGKLDRIIITLYMDEPQKSERAKLVTSLFKKTEVNANIVSEHMATHYSPVFPVRDLARAHVNRPCRESTIRAIINHRAQFLLCCDDVVGNFDLGTFPETSLFDYWYGGKKAALEANLIVGNRSYHPHCSTCPRG